MPNLKQLLCYAWNSYKDHKEENPNLVFQSQKIFGGYVLCSSSKKAKQ